MERDTLITNELKRVDGHAPGSGMGKHKKMCTSPFVFYRGSAQLFYADLASGKLKLPSKTSIPLTTIMGDCHTSNFGFFTEEGSFDEQLVFSVNDFDDACIGNGLWDILRLQVSISLAQVHCKGLVSGAFESEKDFSQKAVIDETHALDAMHAMLDGYCTVLESGLSSLQRISEQSCKAMDCEFLDQTFSDFETPSPLKKRYQKALKVIRGGERFNEKSSLAKAADLSTFPLRFIDDESKFIRLNKGFENHLREKLSPYFFHDIVDIVGRVGAGTGSVNLNRYYAIVGPRNEIGEAALDQSYVVEVKQQRQAAAIHYFPELHPQNSLDPAHLTVKCQRRMQRRADYVLDHAIFDDKHWLIRSRHHAKVGIDPEHIGIGKINTEQGGFEFYANACGEELARAHCRGDRYSLSYERHMLDYIRKHSSNLINVAQEYSIQVKQDWRFLSEVEGR